MEQIINWLRVATDECDTLVKYAEFLNSAEDKDRLKEIMGDEFNHALIALFTAAQLLNITVPTDGIEEAMSSVKFEESGDED